MRVAVLGGGLQGCCTALVLAQRGAAVDLFDRNELLLSRAAVANEGKIHLGYMYGGDPSLSTARMMIRGALTFAPFFARHLDIALDGMAVSQPATYLIHRDSQRTFGQVSDYLAQVHALTREAADGRDGAYFGIEFASALRRWNTGEREAEFGPAVLAAFDTPEVAIDPLELARRVRARVAADPRIRLRLSHTVHSVEDDDGRFRVVSKPSESKAGESYDHVVNALWDGRLAVDEKRGYRPERPWLHRFKYGVSFQRADTPPPRSITIVLGPFGEVVSFCDGLTYLTWYPVCLQGISGDVTPPPWPAYPDEPVEPLRSHLIDETLAALTEVVPALGDLDHSKMSDMRVKGGIIVAWGATDIDDPQSELHRRFEIGVTSIGRYHSVNPGKLTLAPYFADVCADRILPVD